MNKYATNTDYHIKITIENETYIAWYKDNHYAQGTWDSIKKHVDDLKAYHRVKYTLDHQVDIAQLSNLHVEIASTSNLNKTIKMSPAEIDAAINIKTSYK